ncbi:MAG: hypothetical protein GY697_20175 [Desulfobacterales bacterium]|nr:hypothetical protein [Desulfobacterales bacterium]
MRKAVLYTGYIIAAVVLTFSGLATVHAGCEKGDCRNGPGRYAWPDGSHYTGDFTDGKFHGRGTYAWADGKKYTGGFKNDMRSGQGTYTWPNGASYKGEWENGKKAGYGIYTFPDGRKSVGLWENGTLSQEMEVTEVENLLTPKPQQGAPVQAAAPRPAAPAQSAEIDLDKQLAALGGGPEATAAGEESLQATEAAATTATTAPVGPFVISVKKLPLFDGRKFKTWDNTPLLAVGPITPIGTCSVKIDESASDRNAGKLMVKLIVANNSSCPLDFKGFIQAGAYYVKLVSWSGDQAIAPKSVKEISRNVTLEKEAPRSKILFKLQGEGCPL